MKNKLFFFLSLCLIQLITVCSCKDDNEAPSPEPSFSITIEGEDTRPVVPQTGGTITIPFTATGNWTASLMNDRADSWITLTPSSGSAGDVLLSITTTANDTYDERNATIVLRCGDDSENIVVTQKQKDALLVSSSKYEMEAKGGEISVEVQANIPFEVEVKSDWIKQVDASSTRTLTTSVLNFTIDANDTGEKREDEIIIKSGELSETIKVYQDYKKFITLTQKEFTLPEEGGTVDIEVKSTIDYGVKILDNIDWITEIQTRAISTHTLHYEVTPNESYDAREAKIVFYSLEDKLFVDTVSIYQVQLGAILVARNEYQFERIGGSLNFVVQSNLDFDVIISDDWIQQIPSTRGLVDYDLEFTILENKDGKDREGTITIKDKNSDKQQVINIKQSYVDLEREALIALYKATDGDNWTNNTNWCSNKPLSEWYGVYTGTGSNVLDLHLGENNLKGSLPKELGNLKYLTHLTLWDNQLTGEVPNEIGNLEFLTNLYLSNNQFSGQIPDIIWTLPALKVLSLSNNQFTKISSEIKQAQTLESLDISYNSINELPDEIGELITLTELSINNNPIKYLPNDIENLKKLQILRASEMNLNGSIPSFIWNFTSLKKLSLERNHLNGNIPDNIGNLEDLTFLDLQENQICGNIPESMGNLKNLQTLYLNDNQIGGSIPESICNLVDLSIVDISNNNIAGILPTNIGNLVKLEWFNAYNNQLVGTIPESISELKQLSIFDVSNNNITGSIPKGFAELPLLERLNLRLNCLSGAIPTELYQCSRWNNWDPFIFIYSQQEGYILYPENYHVSTDFSKDGDVIVLQNHTKGYGIKLVLMGDLFVDTDMEDGGVYETAMKKAMEGYFSIEPFKSLRDYFDVVTIKAVSKHDWMSGESAFETTRQSGENKEKCVEYAQKALGVDELRNITIILLLKNYPAGRCTREISNIGITSFACIGYEENDISGEFEESLYWVANGFGFGLLGEEYIMHDVKIPENTIREYKDWYSQYNCYANVDFTSNPNQVRWSHFINDPRYSDEEIGVYEGAKWAYGIYRPTEYSVMRERINGFHIINQFNAPSREAIYKRAMKLAYGDSWTYDYEEFVRFDAQGHADFVEAKNKAQTRSLDSSAKNFIKHTPPKLVTILR